MPIESRPVSTGTGARSVLPPVSFFDSVPPSSDHRPEEPPPPSGEADYGNVVPITSRNKRGQEGWKADWHLSDNGSPLPTLHNAMVALRAHPKLCKLIRFDEMARSAMLWGQIPGTPDDPAIPRRIRDADIMAIQEELQQTGLRRLSKSTAQDAIDLRAAQDTYHPVKDYLNGLVWDGTQRVTGWLSRYLGVDGGDYADTIGRLFMIALIARQFDPGCQADYMLILEGPQGEGKSSACRALAGQWFSDNLPNLSRGDPVRLSMHLRGKWLIEIAELSSFSSAETHTLKEFLTQTEERYTPKYARNEVQEPRQCLFIGTTNEGAYLRDATGARRFWPVKVGTIELSDLRTDRDQLLAEAVKLYRDGEPWHPSREFEKQHIAPQQEARYEADPWEEAVTSWLDGGKVVFDSSGVPITDQWGAPVIQPRVDRCTVMQLLHGPLKTPIERITIREQRRVSAILTRMGWEKGRTEKERFFCRPVGT